MLDDVSFIQTKKSTTNASKNRPGISSLNNNSTSSSSTISSTTTKASSKNSTAVSEMSSTSSRTTKPVSVLDKATFPFPCYLEMVKKFLRELALPF